MTPGWNPNALCDGSIASERAAWLVSNEGMSQIAAQQKVMCEFPAHFGGIDMAIPFWNPAALCDGILADERADWLMQNEGMSELAAQDKVMREFPLQFGGMAMGGVAVSGGLGMSVETSGVTINMTSPGMSVAVGPPVVTCSAPAISVAVAPPLVTPFPAAMSVAVCPPVRQAGPQACFKCKGKGFSHDSTMTHDKGPGERCFFCENCCACGGSGMIDAGDQACFKCQGKGFCHNSSMTHDKGPTERCFFCEKCSGCDGTGRIGGKARASKDICTAASSSTYPQGDVAIDCKNCTVM